MRRRPVGALAAAVVAATLFAVLTLAVVTRHGTPFVIDGALHRRAVEGRSSWLTAVAVAITTTGSGLPAYAIAAGAGIAAGPGRRWRTGAAYLLALLAGEGVRLLLLTSIDRPRPPVGDWVVHVSGAAFPSGHATTSALVAALVCVTASTSSVGTRRRGIIALALVWACAVGFTRVYLGVHWPTDVVGGWLLGAALSLPIARALRRLTGPVAARDGGGRPDDGPDPGPTWPFRPRPGI